MRGRVGQLVAALGLPVLVVALYAPSLNGPFLYDDPNAVSQSTLIRSLLPLSRFIELSTRPLTDFSFALCYAVGGLAPRAYHAANILLHALNVLLVYALAWNTLGLSVFARGVAGARTPIAWAAAALFAAHPLATESVAYVSSRSEVLGAFFILLALVAYMLAATTRQGTVRLAAMVILPLSTAAGLGSKEIAVTIPLALLLYDLCFLAGPQWRHARPRWGLIGLAAIPLAVGGVLLLYRAYATGGGLGAYGATAGLGFDRFSRGEYLMTQFGVILHYLRLVVVPVGLTLDYDWPLARTLWAPGVLVPFAVLTFLLIVGLRSVRTQPVLAFAILWTFLILAPTSSVLPIADLAVERRMYLPLFGFSLLGAVRAWDLTGWARQRYSGSPVSSRRKRQEVRSAPQKDRMALFGLVLGIPLVMFMFLTSARAALWANPIGLYRDGVSKAPGNPRVHLNLGVTYLNLGRLDEASEELATAKQLFDRGESVHVFRRIGAFIHYNLGAVLYSRGELQEAAPHLVRSLELGGEYLALRPMAMFLLGNIAASQAQWSMAADRYKEAVRYSPNAAWYVQLAKVQMKNGKPAQARQSLARALRLDPENEAGKTLSRQWRPPRQGKLGPERRSRQQRRK